MKTLTVLNMQSKFELETSFNRRSRVNYIEMLEVALRNLSIVDVKNENPEVMNRKERYVY